MYMSIIALYTHIRNTQKINLRKKISQGWLSAFLGVKPPTTIGKITYLVGIHFSEDSKETMTDKIDRLIRRDIQTGTSG